MEFIDTHSHLYDEAFSSEEDLAVERAVKAGVTRMIVPDIDSSTRQAMFELTERHPGTLFVWMVDIGRIRTRTDVTYFMPHQYGIKLRDNETENLKYLTELLWKLSK